MKRILVPTDFSVNSRSGVRFAIHWATQEKVELIFVHVLQVLRGSSWTDAYYEKYAAQEERNCELKLGKFITGMYGSMKVTPGKYSLLVLQGISADVVLLDYSRKNKKIDYICISTRGAGTFKKIFGSNTGNLITKSEVPVLAIPKNYKTANITSVLYASDIKNYSAEIKKVAAFAAPFKAKIDIVHFSWPDEITFDEKSMNATLKKDYKYGIKMHYEKNDAVHSLVESLQRQVHLKKPSVVVMFTNQQRTIFQKIFLYSKTEALSFQLKAPLLAFQKQARK